MHRCDDAGLSGFGELVGEPGHGQRASAAVQTLQPPVLAAKNLHALWDGELVNALGANDKAITADLSREVAAMSPTQQSEWASGAQEDWIWEGHELARKEIYTRLNIPTQAVTFPAKCTDADIDTYVDNICRCGTYPRVRAAIHKAAAGSKA